MKKLFYVMVCIVLGGISAWSMASALVLTYFEDSQVNKKLCDDKWGIYVAPKNNENKIKDSAKCLNNRDQDLFQMSDLQITCENNWWNYVRHEYRGTDHNLNKFYESYCENNWTSLERSVQFAYWMWMTKYSSLDTFYPKSYITREQIAKMIVNFSKDGSEKINNDCNFNDLDSIDPTLTKFVLSACESGFMKWWWWDFHPQEKVTYAQTITILMRIIEWKKDESVDKWWEIYEDSAVNQWFIEEISNPSQFIVRGEVISWMYNIWNNIR